MSVRLPRPTPLERPLDLRRDGDAVAALLGPLPDRPELWAGSWRPTTELPSVRRPPELIIVLVRRDTPSTACHGTRGR